MYILKRKCHPGHRKPGLPGLPEFPNNSPPPRRVYEYTFLFFKFEFSIILKGGGGPGRPCRPSRPSWNIEPEHRTGTYNRNIEPEHRT